MLRETKLSDNEILFLYFETNGGSRNDTTLIAISKNDLTTIYTVSLPGGAVDGHANEICYLLISLFESAFEASGVKTVVVAGLEFNIDDSVLNIADAIKRADEVGSLVEWICCSESDAGNIPGFYPIQHREEVVVLRRR